MSTAAEPEQASAEGEREREIADPAAEGEKGREITDPAATDGQSAEERHRNAEARRRAQQEEHERKLAEDVEQRTQKKLDAIIASMGKKNPYTGKLITNQAELEAYTAESARRRREDELKAAGLSEETLRQIIDAHPDVKAAKDAAAKMESARKAYTRAAQEESLKDEIRKISRIDPNVKTAQDLINHPKYQSIKKLVKENNHGLAAAFEMATEADRHALETERTAQASARAAAGKNHLVSSKSSGAAGQNVTVPPEVMAGYRARNPRITAAEAAKKYERFLGLKRVK